MTQICTLQKETTNNRRFIQLTAMLFLLMMSSLYSEAQTTLVGLTSNGGSKGKGNAFSISTSGTGFSVIRGFSDWGNSPQGNLLKLDDGNFYGMTYGGGTFNYGSIFKITSSGTVTILKQFDYTNDGGNPTGDLVKGADGNLYGGTTGGGLNGYGTIFKISTSGTFTVIKSLAYNDGVGVYGHLTLAGDGNFYGITYRGGVNGYGTIFKLTSAGVFSVIHNMSSSTDGSGSTSGLTEGSDGNLYGATNNGGASSYGTIFKISKTGTFTTLKSFNGSTDGYYCKSDLVQASDGYFYGTCSSGGSSSSGVIFKINSSGNYTVLKNFSYSSDGGNPSAGLFFNSDGNFYGTTKSGGSKSGGTIFKFTAAGVYTVLHALDFTTEGNGSSSALVKGDDGYLYAMAEYGGTYNLGTVFKTSTSGAFSLIANFNGATTGNAPYSSFIKGNDSAYYCTMSGGGTYGYGSIVKICGGVTSVFHSFKQSTEGSYPKGSLLQASDNNFYGMTSSGGLNNGGTIFKITPSGTFSILCNFKSSTDGANPYGGLIQAKDGLLYGMTSGGGTNVAGTIFKITLSGTFTVLKSFVSSTDGASPYGNLLQASDGSFYGMTNSSGKIFKLTTSGTFSILHSFSSSADGYIPYGSLIQGADKNLYGTCSDGGSNSAGTIFQISLSGSYKVLRSLNAATDGRAPKGSLLQGADGMLYGTTSIGGTYNSGTIFKITTGGTYTVLRQLNLIKDGGYSYGGLIFAPVSNFVANAQTVSVNEDSQLKIKLTGSGSSQFTYIITTNPTHGTATLSHDTVTYKPAKNYNGTDKFSFAANVGCISSAPAAVSINVNPVADAPVLDTIYNKTVRVDSVLTFTAHATDADNGQTITYSIVSAPAGATINATTGLFKWTPATAGTYSFYVKATDNDSPAKSDQQKVTVTVTANTFAAVVANNEVQTGKMLRATIFPNPAADKLNINLPASLNKVSVRIINMNGSVMGTTELNKPNSLLQLNIAQLPAGVYLLRIENNDLNQTLKFVKIN